MNNIELFKRSRLASQQMAMISDETIREVLLDVAEKMVLEYKKILEANEEDLARMDKSNPKYDRLLLNKDRIEAIAADMKNVAGLPSPLGKVLHESVRPNGMKLTKVSVPFGVIGIIYEARPNVTFDVFALCLKSGNACLLKGGSDAYETNKVAVEIIREVLAKHLLDENSIVLLPADREAASELLTATSYVDLIIPRGSQALIDFVRENATVPVIETGAGICHTYFHSSGDVTKGAQIIHNAKTRRPSVCNSLDALLVDESRLSDLPELCSSLAEADVEVFADEKAFSALENSYPEKLLHKAEENHFGTEFLALKMAIKTVSSFHEAFSHISTYSSKHSECIVAEDKKAIELFQKMVDAAAVYANVSTAFTDGAQFGLGAEIGISTQKLHARGPMALAELTSYKWLVEGDGVIREK
ncbi:glutamate-5-semialdehyde dehydrogenase [Prolixibacteraceae bacterium JC049]|nr:glutamate-5-semialdehyde dehydrogenase [Prolixibacteraceae bacterium JC049]